MKERTLQKVDVIVVVADIVGSSQIAQSSNDVYNRLIRLYHKTAENILKSYCVEEELPRDNFIPRAYGDEILIVIKAKGLSNAASHAVKIAMLLEANWINSQFNAERKRDGSDYLRIRIGIGRGRVVIEDSVWNQGKTPEGYVFAKTKRIETNARPTDERGQSPQPYILIENELRPQLNTINGIQLGVEEVLCEEKTKRLGEIRVFRILSYQPFYTHYQKRIRARKNADRWFTKGYIASIGGDASTAANCYRKAIKLLPDNERALNNLAAALFKMGEFKEAKFYVLKSLEVNKNFPDALSNLGAISFQLEAYDDAINVLMRAVKLKPDYAEAFANLAVALDKLERFKEAEAAHKRAIELKPNYAEFYFNYGNSFSDQDSEPEAEVEYRKVLAIRSDFEQARKNLGNSLFRQGITLFDQGKHDDAENKLSQGAEFRPDLFDLWFYLGLTRERLNKWIDAKTAYQRALELRSEDVVTLLNLGEVLVRLTEFKEAEKSYKKVIQLESNNEIAYSNLGNLLIDLGDRRRFPEAEGYCRKAIAIKQDFAIAHFNLARALELQGQLDDAILEAEIAHQLNIDDDMFSKYLNNLKTKRNWE